MAYYKKNICHYVFHFQATKTSEYKKKKNKLPLMYPHIINYIGRFPKDPRLIDVDGCVRNNVLYLSIDFNRNYIYYILIQLATI